MTVGQTVRARFRTVPDQCAVENASWEKRFPLRDAVVAYIHPAGRYVTLETILDGKAVKESFHPNDLREETEMNLKNTTKDKLYAMLCEEQTKRKAAEAIMEKQAENAQTLQERYLSLEKESEARIEALNDELIKANVEIAGLRRERDDVEASVVMQAEKSARLCEERFNLRKTLDEQNAHPWRHLWKCLWR